MYVTAHSTYYDTWIDRDLLRVGKRAICAALI